MGGENGGAGGRGGGDGGDGGGGDAGGEGGGLGGGGGGDWLGFTTQVQKKMLLICKACFTSSGDRQRQ